MGKIYYIMGKSASGKDTIYKRTRTREIPCHRSGTNGRKLVFKRDEIVAWMTARKQETKDEFIKRMES